MCIMTIKFVNRKFTTPILGCSSWTGSRERGGELRTHRTPYQQPLGPLSCTRAPRSLPADRSDRARRRPSPWSRRRTDWRCDNQSIRGGARALAVKHSSCAALPPPHPTPPTRGDDELTGIPSTETTGQMSSSKLISDRPDVGQTVLIFSDLSYPSTSKYIFNVHWRGFGVFYEFLILSFYLDKNYLRFIIF